MTTYLFIGLIIVLAAYLIRARRARSTGSADADTAAAAPRRPSLRRRKPDLPAPAPLPEPAFTGADAPPAPSFGPRPLEPAMSWEPGETIVEPGWPLPGEIAGAWSPSAAPQGPAPLPQVVTEAPPVVEWAPEPASPEPPAADVPDAHPIWVPGQDEPLAVSEPAWIDPTPAEVAAAEALVAGWTPTEVPVDPQPAEPAEPSAPAMPELAWLSETPPAEPAWLADLPAEPVSEEPAAEEPTVQEPVVEEPAPEIPAINWLAAEPQAEDPAPVAKELVVIDEPVALEEPVIPVWTPEPVAEPVAEPVPESVVESVAEPVVEASLEDQSSAVAELVGALSEELVPFGRVPDRLGVTPRMLALMRLLAGEPRSVTDQARALGVSRPMVADLCGRLVVLGLASREPAPADRRRVLVTLTAAGRKAVADAASGPSAEDVAERIGDLSPAERDALVSGLRSLSSRAS